MESEQNPNIKFCQHCGKVLNAKNAKKTFCNDLCRISFKRAEARLGAKAINLKDLKEENDRLKSEVEALKSELAVFKAQKASVLASQDKIPAKRPEKAENPAKTSEKPIVDISVLRAKEAEILGRLKEKPEKVTSEIARKVWKKVENDLLEVRRQISAAAL